MKRKLKVLISLFMGELSEGNKKIPVHDLAVFFSLLISFVSLKSRGANSSIRLEEGLDQFDEEVVIIKQRFPDLFKIYQNTLSNINTELVCFLIKRLTLIFREPDKDADDLISWSYQFLKKGLEKEAFKRIGKNKNKISDSDLLFTTQFFTDRYMVEYLVDESIQQTKKDVQNITVIDCACGGGNFLTYSFDVLYKNLERQKPRKSIQEIVDYILNNAILGFDLDASLARIATLSLFVKASQYALPSESTVISIFGGAQNDILGFLNRKVCSNKLGRHTFSSKLKQLESSEKIKLYLTNPPFMGKRDMDVSLKNQLKNLYPESKGDLCASFIQRIVQCMKDKDILGVVTQNNWLYLSSFKCFRNSFLRQERLLKCVDLGSNAFEDINGEKTNVALCIIGKTHNKDAVFFNLKYKNVSDKRKHVVEKSFPENITFEIDQNLFLENDSFEFAYHLGNRFENIKQFKLYSNYARPMQGTSTGDNTKFVKYAWEVNGSSDWKLVSKGGGFSKWSGLNYYKVLWGINAERIRENEGSAIRNLDRIPETQLVFSDTGTLGLNVRILKEDQVFIASGPGIQVQNGDMYSHLAFLNSRFATFLLKLINPKFTISAGYISKIPVADGILNSQFIAKRSKKCLELKNEYLQRKLPNIEFRHFDYLHITDINAYIERMIEFDLRNDFERLKLEHEIESKIRNQYMFNSNELMEIKSVVGESPFFNKKRKFEISSDELDTMLSSCIDSNCLVIGRSLNGYSVGSESIIEQISYEYGVNPKIVYDRIIKELPKFHRVKKKYQNDLMHKILLYELGVESISNYKSDSVTTRQLFQRLVDKYKLLYDNEKKATIIDTLKIHHSNSFQNKPLLKFTSRNVTVGQENYE